MPKPVKVIEPQYKELDSFTVIGGSGDERDVRHITARKKILRYEKNFLLLTVPVYDKTEYRDTSGSFFTCVDSETYKHNNTGAEYIRDRKKYG